MHCNDPYRKKNIMFKLMFGFLAGVLFSVLTLVLSAIGVWMGSDISKTPEPRKSTTRSPINFSSQN